MEGPAARRPRGRDARPVGLSQLSLERKYLSFLCLALSSDRFGDFEVPAPVAPRPGAEPVPEDGERRQGQRRFVSAFQPDVPAFLGYPPRRGSGSVLPG
jgi:hypothetical protein